MSDVLETNLELFFNQIKHQANRKQLLYDGYNKATKTDTDLFKLVTMITEEVGEVASHIIRERLEAAKAECIDIAHCVFSLFCRLNNEKK